MGAHSATIWHLDWAHPHHGVILASCSFDKYLKTWVPPDPNSNQRPKSNITDWEKKTDESVDRRGSVTDVRFSPVWFLSDRERKQSFQEISAESTGGGGHEEVVSPGTDSGYSNICYLACCTLDGQAKIYKSPHGDSPASTMNPATFSPAPELQILRDKAGFKCFTLDWSRLRQADQLIAIGGEGSIERDKTENNLLILKFNGDFSSSNENDCGSWKSVVDSSSLNIDGPVNIVRFAQNGNRNHVLAIGAYGGESGYGITIMHIDPKSFKCSKMKMIPPESSTLHSTEKCWRLTWDSIGTSLFTCHGSRTTVRWNRKYENDEEVWHGQLWKE